MAVKDQFLEASTEQINIELDNCYNPKKPGQALTDPLKFSH